jgi:hypothetical protein
LNPESSILFREISTYFSTKQVYAESSKNEGAALHSCLRNCARAKTARRRSNLDALPFGRLWYVEVSDAIGYAKFRSRSHHAVIRVYDEAGNVVETHEQAGHFRAP